MNVNLVHLLVQGLSLKAFVCLSLFACVDCINGSSVTQRHLQNFSVSVHVYHIYHNSGPPLKKPKGRMSYNNYEYSSVWGKDKIKGISAKVRPRYACHSFIWQCYRTLITMRRIGGGGMGTTSWFCIESHVLRVPLCNRCLSLLLCCWKHNDDEQRWAHLTTMHPAVAHVQFYVVHIAVCCSKNQRCNTELTSVCLKYSVITTFDIWHWGGRFNLHWFLRRIRKKTTDLCENHTRIRPWPNIEVMKCWVRPRFSHRGAIHTLNETTICRGDIL